MRVFLTSRRAEGTDRALKKASSNRGRAEIKMMSAAVTGIATAQSQAAAPRASAKDGKEATGQGAKT